ncbi:MAG: ECF transporter S component [Eubacteriales bacterium]
MKKQTYPLVLSALMLALCYILPNFTGNIPVIGSMLLPMHLPVFLCGFLCGPYWSALVGFVAPVSRSLLMTMPPMAVAIPMGFEMAVYGFVSGFLFQRLRKTNLSQIQNIYISLISAMVMGRVIYGLIKAGMTFGSAEPYTLSAFIAGTVTSGIPGIILQLVMVPVVVLAVEKARPFPSGEVAS